MMSLLLSTYYAHTSYFTIFTPSLSPPPLNFFLKTYKVFEFQLLYKIHFRITKYFQ